MRAAAALLNEDRAECIVFRARRCHVSGPWMSFFLCCFQPIEKLDDARCSAAKRAFESKAVGIIAEIYARCYFSGIGLEKV